jgi:4-hydroxy-3-methylbut-2-en-1-yl diphosphate synthase IspG/GcpE
MTTEPKMSGSTRPEAGRASSSPAVLTLIDAREARKLARQLATCPSCGRPFADTRHLTTRYCERPA